MKFFSNQWDEQVGACLKHSIPVTPCPACIAEHDRDIVVLLDEMDRCYMDFERVPVTDLFPEGQGWLAERIM